MAKTDFESEPASGTRPEHRNVRYKHGIALSLFLLSQLLISFHSGFHDHDEAETDSAGHCVICVHGDRLDDAAPVDLHADALVDRVDGAPPPAAARDLHPPTRLQPPATGPPA